MSLVFVHFRSISPEGIFYYNPKLHKDAATIVLRFYNNFVKKISLEDYYFFIITNDQKGDFQDCLKIHGVSQDDIYAKGTRPVQNMRYPTHDPTLNWYILKFKEHPSKFSPKLTAWF